MKNQNNRNFLLTLLSVSHYNKRKTEKNTSDLPIPPITGGSAAYIHSSSDV